MLRFLRDAAVAIVITGLVALLVVRAGTDPTEALIIAVVTFAFLAAVFALLELGWSHRKTFEVQWPITRRPPHTTPTEPSSDRAEIEGMIWSITGVMNSVPLTREDFTVLVYILENYRRYPWFDDPQIQVVRSDEDPSVQVQPGFPRQPGELPTWGMRVTGPGLMANTVVRADKQQETLESVKKLLMDLIPQMKHWDAWHAPG